VRGVLAMTAKATSRCCKSIFPRRCYPLSIEKNRAAGSESIVRRHPYGLEGSVQTESFPPCAKFQATAKSSKSTPNFARIIGFARRQYAGQVIAWRLCKPPKVRVLISPYLPKESHN
jgi:hypothetical protein